MYVRAIPSPPARSGIAAAYLSQIETGRQPGSFDAMAKLGRALVVAMDDLEPRRT